jgi:hypothetical protein
MDSDQLLERAGVLIAQEQRSNPLHWIYLSYAKDEGFQGGVIVMAHGLVSAAFEARRRKISPGGQVVACSVPNDKVPPAKYRYRLLTKAELDEVWPDMTPLAELQGGVAE